MATCLWGAVFTALLRLGGGFSAELPADWPLVQTIEVGQSGMIRVSIPVETLDAARPGLEDLRLHDANGGEVAYRVDRPAQARPATRNAHNFVVRLEGQASVATFETDLPQPVDSITVRTAARDFLKAATLEASTDGQRWETLVSAQPIFRTDQGAVRETLSFAAGNWRKFRLTLDDGRSQPIPVTGALVQAASAAPAPAESLNLKIVERDESPGQTRLTMLMPGAHLTLGGLEIDTPEPFFTRPVTLSVRDYQDNEVREQIIARGTVYRVALEGQSPASNLVFAADVTLPTREVILTVQNGDSRPLPIETLHVTRRPIYLTFYAAQPGKFHLLSGNPRSAAPRYDLSELPANLAVTRVTPREVSGLTSNANFRASETVPELVETGTPIDLAKWSNRKKLELKRDGVQQFELDPETLARCQPGFGDLRVVRDGRQLPYLLERTGIRRVLAPMFTLTNDPDRKTVSRWLIRLPHKNLPLKEMTIGVNAPFFKRQVNLFEQPLDERGNPYTVPLAGGSWVRTLENQKEHPTLSLSSSPRTDSLWLEIENGDNPPLTITNVQMFYRATRMIFKASAGQPAWLYYGNPEAPRPSYDIDLVARQLLSAEKNKAGLSPAEVLIKPGWAESEGFQGGAKWIFWVVLVAMVGVLVMVIARLLPKSSS